MKPVVRVGVVGAGSMGKGLFRQLMKTGGLTCVALADIRVERSIACVEEFGCPYRRVDSVASMRNAMRDEVVAVCEDGMLLSECDVVVEASSSVGPAGRICEAALKNGKHVVMMNAEADLMFGPFFLELARAHQVTYTSCDGDQHGVLSRLIDEITLWGFDLVLAGNIKGFLDRYSDPTKIIPEADKRNLDYKMATAYTDGSKLNIEMALLANGYNLRTDRIGMQGPPANDVQEALRLFDLERIWKSGQPVVDYLLGAQPGGGVFVIGHCEDRYQQSMMHYYKMGQGPFYLFYRPYHLCHVEAMKCIVEAVYEKKSLLQPIYGFKTMVNTFAKRDLKQGEVLDGLGGYTCYGLIENGLDGLPICLANDVVLKRDIRVDEKIGWDDVIVDWTRDDMRLYENGLGREVRNSCCLSIR